MAGFVDILEHVLVPLAWPLLAAVLLWRLFCIGCACDNVEGSLLENLPVLK